MKIFIRFFVVRAEGSLLNIVVSLTFTTYLCGTLIAFTQNAFNFT